MLGLAIGEVLGLRRPYNGVRLGFMVNNCLVDIFSTRGLN